jgi:phenylacetate-CoA ligase
VASISRLLNKSPFIIKRCYYKIVPFEKRYGYQFIETYNFLKNSIEWDRDKLKEFQFEKLKETIINAFENVPYYHKLFIDNGINPNISSFEDVKKIPYLTKNDVRLNYNALISKKFNKNLITFKTSGSTGEKFQFEGTDELFKKEAAFVLRAYNMHNSTLYDKTSIWIRRYSPKNGDPIFKIDYELNRIYMNPFNLSLNTIENYVKYINKTKAQLIVTYPSLANFMALLMEEKNLQFDYVQVIHCASEMVLDEWRNNVNRILGIKLKAHYGMMEKISFFCNTKESDKYAESLEYGYTEIIEGEVVGTGFLNNAMPFIRYKPGDLAVLNNNIEFYKSLPYSVNDFIGRSTDMIYTLDGRKLSGVNFYTMMYKIQGVEMFQIIQKTLSNIDVNIIPSKHFNLETYGQIIDGINDRVGKCNIKINKVSELERTPSGKIKTIINECES